MREFFDRLILGFPVLFIKQYPYAWFALIALWAWPPDLAWVFLAVIVIGILALRWRASAWVSTLRRTYAAGDMLFYIDRPGLSYALAARNIGLLAGGSLLFAYFMQNQFGLTFWQFFALTVGFVLCYRDTQFFGAETIYVVTARGIGIYFVPGHLDYRLFLNFNDIGRVERCQYQKDADWDYFVRNKGTLNGILLHPRSPAGFSKRLGKLFIAPNNIEQFLEQVPLKS